MLYYNSINALPCAILLAVVRNEVTPAIEILNTDSYVRTGPSDKLFEKHLALG